MTAAKIQQKQAIENLPYELAVQVRALLDNARQQHGKSVGDAADWYELESKVIELVTEGD
jgi:hypothetical protein